MKCQAAVLGSHLAVWRVGELFRPNNWISLNGDGMFTMPQIWHWHLTQLLKERPLCLFHSEKCFGSFLHSLCSILGLSLQTEKEREWMWQGK